MSRSTLFFPGGGTITNKPTYLYNKYKPGSGIGGSSIAIRRAKNRLATVCNGNTCSPCYNRLGLYSQNPNGYVPCLDNTNITPTPTQQVPLTGSFTFSFEFINPSARTFSPSNPPSQELISNILPMVTVPGVFEINHTSTIIGNTVYVEIQTFLYEQPTYTSNFGLGFNKTYKDPEIPGPDISLNIFYNSIYNLTCISSNNCPFSKLGSQFKGLTQDFNISPSFKPYFLQGTSLKSCFEDCANFNSDISNWEVSQVTNMSHMFKNATTFNQPIGGWNTSNVTDMSGMFKNATTFNQPIGGWNTSNVTDMSHMFYGAITFNQPIGLWNTSKVINMFYLFYGATTFNQPINYNPDTGAWNTSNVNNMGYMFQDATSFNQAIGLWNTSNVTYIPSMFQGATLFNQDISLWDVSRVVFMSFMFQGAISFKQNISNWTPYDCINMIEMFSGIDINNPDSNDNQDNYNALLNSWGTDPKLSNMQTDVELDSGNSKYGTSAITARNALITNNNWVINDGGLYT